MAVPVTGTGVNFDRVTDQIGKASSKIETEMDKAMADLEADPSNIAKMQKMQQVMSKFSIINQLMSTTIQQVSEALKSTLQKF
jgi:hypothetical protein